MVYGSLTLLVKLFTRKSLFEDEYINKFGAENDYKYCHYYKYWFDKSTYI